MWGPPPGLRSSAQSLNNEQSESVSQTSDPSDSKAGAILSEESFPDLREIYKQNEAIANEAKNISFSQNHVPVPPSLDDRPPGLAASQDAAQNTQKVFGSSENTHAPRWWERPHSSTSTLPSDESWDGAGWRMPSQQANPSTLQENTQHNEKGLFEEWPELTQMLEEKNQDETIETTSNPSIPSNAERIPSSRTISEERDDPQQLFRSMLPNVNVSFRQSPQASQRTPSTQAPPGLQSQRDKWNPMMGGGVFGSPWQMFPQEQHANSQPSLSRPFWPHQHNPFGNRQETENPNSFGWHNPPASTRQEEPAAQHPFSLLSHLNQSQNNRQQPNNEYNQQGNQVRQSAPMGNVFNQFQRNENPNGNASANGWMNSSHVGHAPPPGISHGNSKPQEQSRYGSMPQFQRPEQGMYSRPPGMNGGPPPGFGNGHHSKYCVHLFFVE